MLNVWCHEGLQVRLFYGQLERWIWNSRVFEARGFYMKLILLGTNQELRKYLLNRKKIL